MTSIHYFIVKPVNNKRYNNTTNIEGVDFITSVSQENHLASNREARVISTPLLYKGPIKTGDVLLVHHNVFKYYYDMKGRQKSSMSFFQDDIFFVELDQFFMYKQNNKWNCHDRYCFIKPINKEDGYLVKSFKEEPLVGIVKYTNEYLKNQNVKEGDKVVFKPESEYEFNVDGEKLYRMYDHQITVVL